MGKLHQIFDTSSNRIAPIVNVHLTALWKKTSVNMQDKTQSADAFFQNFYKRLKIQDIVLSIRFGKTGMDRPAI